MIIPNIWENMFQTTNQKWMNLNCELNKQFIVQNPLLICRFVKAQELANGQFIYQNLKRLGMTGEWIVCDFYNWKLLSDIHTLSLSPSPPLEW
jgi:hypothetical protein